MWKDYGALKTRALITEIIILVVSKPIYIYLVLLVVEGQSIWCFFFFFTPLASEWSKKMPNTWMKKHSISHMCEMIWMFGF